ncbi:MAG: histidine phosphatase family protein [Nitrosomonadales bacterium]|nr:histidine phosphatase family protein [Nitrosomonadales bacterium]
MSTRICLIRHGETDWNATRRIQGQTDIPLNETGHAQAQAMAANSAHYDFSAIYSSDLSRAFDTAQAVAARGGLEVIKLAQLRERHFGIFQGLTADEAAQRYPEAYAHYKGRDLNYGFETGESLLGLAQRVTEAVEWMVRQHSGQTIAVVCHAGVLDIVYRKATGRALHAPRDFAIPNCALNWFRCDLPGGDGQGWHLEVWDGQTHLSRAPMESVE